MTNPQRSRRRLTLKQYEQGIVGKDRSALAQAITLVESSHPEDQKMAQKLLTRLMQEDRDSLRIGVTGVPGVGKSTLIDAFGTNLTSAGHQVAVLAIDPTSSRTGGSILGDKTRMDKLATDPNAYVRPSPTSGVLGGVARKTRETITLCEAAGFDVIIVETVGVGQSETLVANMVDFFLVLMLPGAGDELQGIKKGILEIADLIAINKADGDGKQKAMIASGEYRAAMHILTPKDARWNPPVLICSGLLNEGLGELWAQIIQYKDLMIGNGAFEAKRQHQAVAWMKEMLESQILQGVLSDTHVRRLLEEMETEVASRKLTAVAAVERVMDVVRHRAPMS